jgi:integrase
MEIGGLLNNELLLDLNVPYLLIRPNHIRRLKTLASERKVPLTDDALDILREYLQAQNNTAPDAPVFLSYGRDGGMDPLSQNLRNIIRKQMKITDRRLVPYSTRHTLKDKMRLLRTPLAYQNQIMGHRQSNEIADGYGEGDPLIYIQQELQKASELTDWGLEAGAR